MNIGNVNTCLPNTSNTLISALLSNPNKIMDRIATAMFNLFHQKCDTEQVRYHIFAKYREGEFGVFSFYLYDI
jgi:hypothetical protein